MLLAKGWEHVEDVLLVKIIMPQQKCMLYASSPRADPGDSACQYTLSCVDVRIFSTLRKGLLYAGHYP